RMRDAADDLFALLPEMLGREDLVGLGVRIGLGRLQEGGQFGVAPMATGTVGQVHCGRRIERLAKVLGKEALVEAVVVQVRSPCHYALPPSSPRSLRAALNRWTLT